ncbi:MAG: DNA ligase D, partial [Pseudoxanthomonas sp.]
MSLLDYGRKRRFADTPEPDAQADKPAGQRPIFVVQLHRAGARHYDFRLEVDGALRSWAVPKGPSLRAGEKRLAVEVEDHPLAYATFEGDIPEGNYGAGHVDVFDQGTWASEGDPLAAISAGKLDFVLQGGKLKGGWKLVRTQLRGKQKQWLLIKRGDQFAADLEADDLVGKILSKAPKKSPGRKVSSAARQVGASKASSRKWAQRALAIEGAREGGYPSGFTPQLAGSSETAPTGDQWLHEIKWDGYRMLADLIDGKARLRSRGKLDWTGTFPEVARAVEALPVDDVRLDGELVVIDEEGRSDFNALQRAIDGTSRQPLRYVVFDMPGIAGVDLSRASLVDRKQLLKALLGKRPGTIAYSEHVLGHGREVFEASGRKGLEGIVSKRFDAAYSQSRSRAWVKVKHEETEEFVVVGYTAPKGSRSGFGSLLMATPESGRLRYVGRVGTGFDDATLKSLQARLEKLQRVKGAVTLPAHVPFSIASVHWVKPRLVAEVAFRGWAKEGLLRQASFKRLREDKSMSDLDTTPEPMALTHAERIVYPDAGISKGDVAGYYRKVARWMLPELVQRPLSLLRCPDGAQGECFFQKHHSDALGKSVRAISLQQKSGKEDYLYIEDEAGLLELVQMNALEFHPWGARIEAPESPDRLVFDLDPGPGVSWAKVKMAARDIRKRLLEARLESWLRMSGGKGLHLVVPITPGPTWEEVKDFCSAFAEALAAHAPDTYVASMSKAKREGRIFVDWLRNARGATSVCSWSLRAREHATVAMPLRWEELAKITSPGMYTMERALQRASRLRKDPWEGI